MSRFTPAFALAGLSSLLACASGGSRPGPTAASAVPQAWTASAERARTVPVYVAPYYFAAETPEEPPRVNVGAPFDGLLASDRPEDVIAARDLVEANPEMITPMTMMVLAIRLYDTGSRDDAVFWFYAARERFRVLEAVLDVRDPGLSSVASAMYAFMQLAGEYMNGYLFCDPDAYVPLWTRAVAWTETHPYGALHLPELRARPGDRVANIKAAIEARYSEVRQADAFMAENRETIREARAANGADARFCWRE